MTTQTERILLIGTGAFISETVLPAISINQKNCKVTAVMNKSGILSDEFKKFLPHLTAHTSLSAIDLNSIDIVFISVPQKIVLTLLQQLHHLGMNDKKIVIATPIVPLQHITKLGLFKAFKRLYAFEFVPELPTYQTAKSLIENQNVGTIKKIQFNHCGYLYHGLAALRHLAGSRKISKITAHCFGAFNEYQLKFNRALNATILEPKDYKAGSFLIAGTSGIISDYPIDCINHFHIDVNKDNIGVYQSTLVNGELQQPTEIEQMASHYFHQQESVPHITRQLFIVAAASLLHKVINNDIESYQCYDAIYDHLIIRIAKKIGIYINPFAYLNLSPLNSLLKWLSTAKNWRY